jgi:pimeloyl-ACP methyl ester carboxylesterase
MTSLLDRLYARISNQRLFFRDGWGDLSPLREVQERGFDPGPIRKIAITWDREECMNGMIRRQGQFPSSYDGPGLPEESRTAYVEWIMPDHSGKETPVCIHLAATGDEGFERRRLAFAQPLARAGIGSIILENPFYGQRRPAGQHSKMLRYVSDLWTMGVATIQEGRSLSRWLQEEGYRKQVCCGISMGGHMAAKVGVLSDAPMAMVCFVTPHSAAAVFTEGLLKRYCDWQALGRELGGNGYAMQRMEELLQLTDIRLLPSPARPQDVFLIGARQDAYIPPGSIQLLHKHWPGSSLRWIGGGHVGAFLFYRKEFLRAIMGALKSMPS